MSARTTLGKVRARASERAVQRESFCVKSKNEWTERIASEFTDRYQERKKKKKRTNSTHRNVSFWLEGKEQGADVN